MDFLNRDETPTTQESVIGDGEKVREGDDSVSGRGRDITDRVRTFGLPRWFDESTWVEGRGLGVFRSLYLPRKKGLLVVSCRIQGQTWPRSILKYLRNDDTILPEKEYNQWFWKRNSKWFFFDSKRNSDVQSCITVFIPYCKGTAQNLFGYCLKNGLSKSTLQRTKRSVNLCKQRLSQTFR